MAEAKQTIEQLEAAAFRALRERDNFAEEMTRQQQQWQVRYGQLAADAQAKVAAVDKVKADEAAEKLPPENPEIAAA